MGIFCDGTAQLTGPLHSATLNFKWYATAAATYTVRLTANQGVEENYTWTVAEDQIGKWNAVSLPVATSYPQVAQQWNDYVGKGQGYVFSVVMEGGKPESIIYFDDIVYTNLDDAWKAPETPEIIPPTSIPAMTLPESDVLSVFSPYGNMAYNIGGWGQSTQCETVNLDGGQAVRLTNFNYLGWEFPTHFDVSDYDFMSVSFYPCEKTTFGFTPISPDQERGWVAPEVKLNEWNTYNVPLTYFNNVNFSDIFQIKFDQGKLVEGYLANVYFYKDGDKPEPPVVKPGATFKGSAEGSYEQNLDGVKNYPFTLEYTVVYNEDQTLTVNADIVWSAGEPVGIVPGSVFINNVLNDFTMPNGVRTATTSATYSIGEVLNMNLYIPVAAGLFTHEFTYVVGTDNLEVSAEMVEAEAGEVSYYNLMGVRVANPEHGIFIRVQGDKAVKVRL